MQLLSRLVLAQPSVICSSESPDPETHVRREEQERDSEGTVGDTEVADRESDGRNAPQQMAAGEWGNHMWNLPKLTPKESKPERSDNQ